MDKLLEQWPANSGYVYLLTRERERAKHLTKILGRPTTYEQHGRVVAWQFLCRESKLRFVEKQISKIAAVENKQVAEAGIRENAFRPTNMMRLDTDIVRDILDDEFNQPGNVAVA